VDRRKDPKPATPPYRVQKLEEVASSGRKQDTDKKLQIVTVERGKGRKRVQEEEGRSNPGVFWKNHEGGTPIGQK